MLWVTICNEVLPPAVTVSGLGVAVTAKSGAVTTMGDVAAEFTLFQLESPE